MNQKPFPLDVPGARVEIHIPSLNVQLCHPIFPPESTAPLSIHAVYSPVIIDMINMPPVVFYQWILTNAKRPDKIRALNPQGMEGLINLALANKWKVKGYEPTTPIEQNNEPLQENKEGE